jgi:hypothetical protein
MGIIVDSPYKLVTAADLSAAYSKHKSRKKKTAEGIYSLGDFKWLVITKKKSDKLFKKT